MKWCSKCKSMHKVQGTCIGSTPPAPEALEANTRDQKEQHKPPQKRKTTEEGTPSGTKHSRISQRLQGNGTQQVPKGGEEVSSLDKLPTENDPTNQASCRSGKRKDEETSNLLPMEKNNPGNIVRYNKFLCEKIERNYAKLTETIYLPSLWPYLRQVQVIDQTTEERMKNTGANPDQILALLDYLMKNPIWKIQAFFRALCDTDQAHIISNILGLNPEHYKDGSQGGKEGKQQLPPEVQKGIASHREYYFKTLMMGHLMDIEELDRPYNMKNCYIQLVATADEELVNPIDIKADKAMSVKAEDPQLKTALLQGPPGAGKTCFIRNYAYKWSKPTPQGERPEEQKMWDLVVILHAATLKLTKGRSAEEHILQAIKQNINAPEHEIKAIVKCIENGQIKLLIIPDGLDECRNDDALKMIRELVDQSHKNKLPYSVLATARTGLCPLKQSTFDRRMTIEGFTIEQGVHCVTIYYSEIKKPSDDSVLEYIMESRHELDHILKNPLRTHMLSVVTADGTLKLQPGKILKWKELLTATEVSTITRQLEKQLKSSGNPNQISDEVASDFQRKMFYKISLYALLKDIRVFDESLLRQFKIHDRNPYFAFMKRRQQFNTCMQNIMEWHFTHEMFHEYFAACALQVLPKEMLQYFLLYLCSRSEFRNTQRILFSSLGNNPDQIHILADMMQVMVSLKGERKNKTKKREWIFDLQRRVESLMPDKDLLQILLDEGQDQITRATTEQGTTALWNDITSCFKPTADKARKYNLFKTMIDDKSMMSHIYNCLQEVPEENQAAIFDQSIGSLLPCKEGKKMWYATGWMRWSVIEEKKGLIIHSWSPVDALQLIQQHYQKLQQVMGDAQEDKSSVSRSGQTDIRFEPCLEVNVPSMGGKALSSTCKYCWASPQEDNHLSPEAWSNLLSEMSRHLRVSDHKLEVKCNASSTISAKGLLDALLLVDTQNHLKQLLVEQKGGWREVCICNSNINIDGDLLEWIVRYKAQYRVAKVTFPHLNSSICPGDKALMRQSSGLGGTTTWYAAGDNRWASITDNTTSLTINAWTPSDTSQVKQQQLHHLTDDTMKSVSQQTWEVSKQQGDVDDRVLVEKGTRHLEKICICVPSASLGGSVSGFTDLWGDPAEQLQSPQAWSELLIEMSQQWEIKADKLEVKWDKSCAISVKGLLNALLPVEQQGGWREVNIYNVTIRDILEWSSQHRSQLRVAKVTFPDLNSSIFPGDMALMRQSSGNRDTTWYPTGGTRWSSIAEDSDRPIIYSWSLSDACQLIQQHGQPHHPKWTIQHDDTDQQEPQQTQGVTTHKGAAGSRSRSGTQIRRVYCVSLHIPSAGKGTSDSTYTDCWGAPPADQLLSSQAWSELLGEMSQQWRVRAGSLYVYWNGSSPVSVKGLLDVLLLQDTQQYLRELLREKGGGWRDVWVWHGNIASSDLCEWTRRYTQQSVVRVDSRFLICNLSPDGGSSREDQEAAVRAIQHTVHGGWGLFDRLTIK